MDDVDEIVSEFLVESHENLDQLDRDLVALEQEPGSRELLSSVFRTIHTIKGTSGFLAFDRLEQVTHVGENLLVELRDGRREMDQRTTDVLLEMVDAVRAILRAVEADGTEGDVEVDAVIGRIREVLEGAAPVAPEPSAGDEVTPAPAAIAPAAPEGPPVVTDVPAPRTSTESLPAAESPDPAAQAHEKSSPRSAADASIRVDVDLLDTLMRQVGELVLARNAIARIAEGGADADLVRAAQWLSLIASELQEGVMKTRMQPIEHVWSKVPRMVRDLTAGRDRSVRLELTGGDTELDRGLLEAIKDPLTHLIRNAVDHGIEDPQVRSAAGKATEGLLALRAYHAGGQVVVEVVDDGAGIDHERVGAKAVERGLRTAEQVAAMTAPDLLQLLFLPGFSTAERVTNVSGRGVGMDVVRTRVEAVGGTVDVESAPGRGTTWRLRIPLTLAIMPALTVESAGRQYEIPQVSLLELVALDPQEVGGVEHVGSAPVHRLRGDLLPLVDLRDVLGAGSRAAGAGTVIAVLQSDTRRFGLVVDRVLNTEEIVVKPLSGRLKSIGLYAGATLLGDGSVSLILDVQAIARRVLAGELAEDGQTRSVEEHATGRDADLVLLAGIGQGRQVAIPLDAVTRLEQLPAATIESSGGRDVLQYRGAIAPVVHLPQLLGAAPTHPAGGVLNVVVCSRGGRSVAIAVEQVLDIVADDDADHSDVAGQGTLGSTVLGGRVTELVDIRSLVESVDPLFFASEHLVGV